MGVADWLGWITIALFVGSINGQNFHKPNFSEPFYDLKLSEYVRISATVLTVIVDDLDTGDAGAVTLSLNDTTHFIIEQNGAIKYDGGLDYEKPELREITLLITARDRGSPSLSTNVLLFIHLMDENDSKPVFTKLIYQMGVADGAPAGHLVGTVTATDRDESSNVTYTLVKEDDFFEIDLLSGELRTKQSVNKSVFTPSGTVILLQVFAYDGLNRVTARAVITIYDLNRYPPQFNPPEYAGSVAERGSGGPVRVLAVSASDADSGSQAAITYSLHPGNYSDQFTIASGTGAIEFTGTLDREDMKEPRAITLLVIATDIGVPPRSSSASVIVNVTDIDDNGPRFDVEYFDLELFKDFLRDLTITGLPSAVDPDSGPNAVVTYDLSPEGRAVFDIEPFSGNLLTKYSCRVECALSNVSQFQFDLFAINAANPAIPGDQITVRVRLVDRPTTTPTASPNITTEIPLTAGSTEPGLTLTELIIIIVISCLILLVIFIIILVLLLRRRNTERKKDRIDFNPSNYPPEKVENEVPCE